MDGALGGIILNKTAHLISILHGKLATIQWTMSNFKFPNIISSQTSAMLYFWDGKQQLFVME